MAPAAEVCRAVLAATPTSADAHHLLGLIAYAGGDFPAALTHVHRAVDAGPGDAQFHNSLGAVQRAAGQTDASVASFRTALRLDPRNAQAAANLGNALAQLGRFADAAECYRRAIGLSPAAFVVQNNLGNVLRELGQGEAAMASYREALRLNPGYAEASSNLGYVLASTGRLDEAVEAYRNALRLAPGFVPAHLNLGNALRDLGQFDDAEAAYRAAIGLAPQLSEAHHNLAVVLLSRSRLDEAEAANRRALALRPDFVEALSTQGDIQMRQAQPAAANASYRLVLEHTPNALPPLASLIATQNYLDTATPTATLALARHYGALLPRSQAPHSPGSDPAKGLRVGLVSADFRDHSVSQFLLPLLRSYDQAQLEFAAYSSNARDDGVTAQLRGLIPVWRDVRALGDAEAADLVRADGVDVLIDLSGYTEGGRLGLLARKPAPVQVSWLGYSGSSGVPAIDYCLVDPRVAPVGAELAFSETLWRLPQTYLCFGTLDAPLPGPLPALRNGHVTFGSFNNIAKLSPRTLATWAQVLAAVPNSRLLIKSSLTTATPHVEQLPAALAVAGVDLERVELIGRVDDRQAHLALYDRVDIGLDPFPYNGTTTTCEALWMGVPVLTRRGNSFASRVGESILSTVGLTPWIADDSSAYVRAAVGFAADLSALAELRSSLRGRLAASPLGDAAGFARDFEAALRGMWQAHCGVAPPAGSTR